MSVAHWNLKEISIVVLNLLRSRIPLEVNGFRHTILPDGFGWFGEIFMGMLALRLMKYRGLGEFETTNRCRCPIGLTTLEKLVLEKRV